MPLVDLSKKVALVTGVGQNIGLATAQVLAAAGATMAVNDIDASTADSVARDLSAVTPTIAVPADVRDRSAVQQMVESVLSSFGRIDILVNNAGRGCFATVLEMEESEWDLELDTNLKGTFLVSQAVARAMVAGKNGGRIICLASTPPSRRGSEVHPTVLRRRE